jgi:hypothetical protein
MTQEKAFPEGDYLRVGLRDIGSWMDKLFLKPGKLYAPKFGSRELRLYSRVSIDLNETKQPVVPYHGIQVGNVLLYKSDIINKPVRWGHGDNAVLCLESFRVAVDMRQMSGIGNLVKVIDGDGVVGWSYFVGAHYLSRFQEMQT